MPQGVLPLNAIEDCAAELFGPERIRAMAGLVMEYDRAGNCAGGNGTMKHDNLTRENDFFGEEKSSPILLQIAPPVMLARLGVGFCFADAGRRSLI